MNLHRMLFVLVSLSLAPPPLLSQSGGEPMRAWTSTDGKRIEASFVKLAGTEVVLRMADGKVYNVPLARLSKADDAHIAELIKKNPAIGVRAAMEMLNTLDPPKSYGFGVSWSKSQVSVAPKVIKGYDAKVTTWKPKFKVTNSSARELAAVTLVYQVQIKRERDEGQPEHSFAISVVEMPLMKPNQAVEVEGKPFETLTAKLQPGYITTDGSRRNKSDDVLGVVVKLMHNGRVVHEHKSGIGVQDKLGDKMRELGLLKEQKP